MAAIRPPAVASSKFISRSRASSSAMKSSKLQADVRGQPSRRRREAGKKDLEGGVCGRGGKAIRQGGGRPWHKSTGAETMTSPAHLPPTLGPPGREATCKLSWMALARSTSGLLLISPPGMWGCICVAAARALSSRARARSASLSTSAPLPGPSPEETEPCRPKVGRRPAEGGGRAWLRLLYSRVLASTARASSSSSRLSPRPSPTPGPWLSEAPQGWELSPRAMEGWKSSRRGTSALAAKTGTQAVCRRGRESS